MYRVSSSRALDSPLFNDNFLLQGPSHWQKSRSMFLTKYWAKVLGKYWMVVDPANYTKITHNISGSIQILRWMTESVNIFKTFRKTLNAPQNIDFLFFCTLFLLTLSTFLHKQEIFKILRKIFESVTYPLGNFYDYLNSNFWKLVFKS